MCTTFPDIKYTQVSTTTYKGPNPQLVRTKSYNRVHLITSRINTSSIKHQLLYSQSYIALHSLQVFLKWTFSLRQITRDSFVYSPNETAARGAAELCPCVFTSVITQGHSLPYKELRHTVSGFLTSGRE